MTELREKLKQELLKIYNSTNLRGFFTKISQKNDSYYDNLRQLIIQSTDYLPKEASWGECVYHIAYDLYEIPKCKNCKTNIARFRSFTKGYSEFCGTKCSNNDSAVQERKRQAYLKKYGVDHPSKLERIKEQKKQKCLDKFGKEHYFQTDECKEQIKQSSLEKHGVEHHTQSPEIQKKKRKTNLERYGHEHAFTSEIIREKSKKTNLERYGAENPFGSKIIQEQIKQTLVERYGVEHILQRDEFKEKLKQTTRERHGVDWGMQSSEIREKNKKTVEKRYGVSHVMRILDIKEKVARNNIERTFKRLLETDRLKDHYLPNFNLDDFKGVKNQWYEWKCLKCNTIFKYSINNGIVPRCPTCYPYSKSSGERELSNFCKELNLEIRGNDRVILAPHELDVYIPNLDLAIEFNGLYWHTELNGKGKYYHQNKSILCLKQKIDLIQIFEDEWRDKQAIIKSILLNKFGMIEKKIPARKCQIYSIKTDYALRFLFDNHIQGSFNGIHFGLSYNDELVSVITIGKSRFDNKYDLEIYRFCSKINTVVVGGLGKLVSYIRKIYPGKSIISYADLRYGTGKGYKKVGFNPIRITSPGYYYFKNGNRYSRQQFQKHKLKNILESFDPNLTEWENMQLNGYDRIWDCGNVVYELI